MDDHWPIAVPDLEPVALLGSGGFGQVWSAVQTDLDRPVAVKIGHRPLTSDDDRRRFDRECKALGRLSGHPHIIGVHTSGVSNGLPYLVMTLVDGGTLAEHGPRLGDERLRVVADQLCQALAAAHEMGILHRDLKPENVFLQRDGRAVLGDFGIARIGDGNNTATGAVTASMAYAPPEILAGGQPTAVADVYGIAVTIVSAAIGRSPFSVDSPNLEAVVARVLAGHIVPLEPYGISPEFEALLRRALDRDPARRPQSADAFRIELSGLATSQPTPAAPSPPTPDTAAPVAATTSGSTPPLPPITSPPTPDNPAGLQSPTRFAPGGPAIEAPPGSWPAATTTESTPPSTGGANGWLFGAIGALAVAGLAVVGILLLGRDSGDSGDLDTASVTGEEATDTDSDQADDTNDVNTANDGSAATTPDESTPPTESTTSTTTPAPLVLPLNGPQISNLTDIPTDLAGVDPLLGPADSPQFCDERPDITGLTDTLGGVYPLDNTTDASLRQVAMRMHRFGTDEQAAAFVASYTAIPCDEWTDDTLFADGSTTFTATIVRIDPTFGDETVAVDQKGDTPVGINLWSRTVLVRQGTDVLKLVYFTVRPDELEPATDALLASAADALGY